MDFKEPTVGFLVSTSAELQTTEKWHHPELNEQYFVEIEGYDALSPYDRFVTLVGNTRQKLYDDVNAKGQYVTSWRIENIFRL